MTLADWAFAVFLLAAVAVFFLPLYFAFTYSPFCLVLFCFSWIPAWAVAYVGTVVHDMLK